MESPTQKALAPIIALVNGHRAVRTNADPPAFERRGGSPGIVALNMTDAEREALWLMCHESRETHLSVPRRALIHLLLDHANLLDKLISARTRLRPPRQ